ncbi:MAG: TonB-dependent receptor [Prolixibacteraceae bacterium]|jgi:TonB-linked SusC/RagA family outer membrane protein|nr:TonB-dependent receptor [Prolixibacteraceae bacterium]
MKNHKKIERLDFFKFRRNKVPSLFMALAFLLIALSIEARMPSENLLMQQQFTVSGTVVAEDAMPLPGVNIIEKGTSNGTTTDFDGRFTLKLNSGSEILLVSFIGYLPQEIAVASQSNLTIHLKPDVEALDEVVVVGYGTQKKATLTGSVASVKGGELKKSPAINFSNTLSGRIPGVVAYNRSGEPGYDGATIRIRGINTLGDNAPLIVVDGIAGRNLGSLDPNDIENISVLKDASAAIYGAQAANGVILITTKRGKAGKPKAQVNYNYGFTTPTIIPPMADAATYATMLNEVDLYDKKKPRFTDEEIQKFRDGSDPWSYPNTDWFGDVFRSYTPQTSFNGTINGGTEKLSYFLSLGGRYQDGIYEKSATNYQQYNFRTNIDCQISDNIRFGFDVSGRNEIRNYPTRGSGDIFRMLMRGKPTENAFWPTGEVGPDIEYGNNPAIITTDETGFDLDNWYILESKLSLDVKFPAIKGLGFQMNAAYDKSLRNRKRFSTPWYLYTWDGVTYDDSGTPLLQRGRRGFEKPELFQEMNDNQNYTINALLKYDFQFADHHNFSLLLGSERNEGNYQWFNASRMHYDSDIIAELFAGGNEDKDNNGGSSESARLNYFGRLNYNFSEKYLIEFVFRYDGSYNFPKDKRFGFFPGVSMGWRISEENFWKDNLSVINHFKIRGSWGQTGNDRINAYQFMSNYEYATFSGTTRWLGMGQTGVLNMLQEGVLGNPSITWEVANQSNIGFDAELWNGKISMEGDYFYYHRSNILLPKSQSTPNTAGIEGKLPDENIGETENKGFDFQLTYRDKIGEFHYSVSINGGQQKNKILFWDEQPGAPEYQLSTGHPIDSRNNLYYLTDGIYNDSTELVDDIKWSRAQLGDVVFQDVNGDSIINGLDRVRLDKNTIPTFTGGVNINMSYRNFDLTILLQGAAGAHRYINTESGDIGNYLQESADDRWTVDNPNATNPRTWNRSDEYWKNNDNTFFLQSTDYIRLKNLEFGYTMPNSIMRKLNMQGLRIYFSGLNLITLDKLKSFDPESDSASGNYYPLSKTFNFGLTLTF